MTKCRSLTLKVLLVLFLLAPFVAEAGTMEDERVRIGITIYPDRQRDGMREEDAQLITNMLTNELAGNRRFRLY